LHYTTFHIVTCNIRFCKKKEIILPIHGNLLLAWMNCL
jgi:hypothetical protein